MCVPQYMNDRLDLHNMAQDEGLFWLKALELLNAMGHVLQESVPYILVGCNLISLYSIGASCVSIHTVNATYVEPESLDVIRAGV